MAEHVSEHVEGLESAQDLELADPVPAVHLVDVVLDLDSGDTKLCLTYFDGG